RHGRRAPLLVEHDVAAARSERDLDGPGELLHALENLGAGLAAEQQLLGSHVASLKGSGIAGRALAGRAAQSFSDYFFSPASTPSTSSSRRITYSVPSILTSVPLYLPISTRSPFFTSIAMRLPSSVSLPGPTATTSPSCGFSFAVSGMMIPPRIVSCSSMRRIRIRSARGRTFMTLLLQHPVERVWSSIGLGARGRALTSSAMNWMRSHSARFITGSA